MANVTSAIVVLQWGRMGDHYGRKPILLLNSCGLAIAIISFGLSRTFAALVFSKVLEGLCKASKPTIKSAVAESSDEHRMAFIFSLLPMMHVGGVIVGLDSFFACGSIKQLTIQTAHLLEEHLLTLPGGFLAILGPRSGQNSLIYSLLVYRAC